MVKYNNLYLGTEGTKYATIIPSRLKKALPSKIEHIYNNIKYDTKMMNEAKLQSKSVQ